MFKTLGTVVALLLSYGLLLLAAPVLLALLMLSSVLVIAANLATDVVYRLIDPRIRVGGART